MSFDLYQDETREQLSKLRPVSVPEADAFDGFFRGTAMYTMQGFAKTARAIDMAGAVAPIVQDAFTNGTEAQDRYFREHDDALGSAVDFWTPKPNEVGTAAQIAGGFIGQLPLIIASPHVAVGAQVLDTAEDLAKAGVSAPRAVAAGVAQGAGLATGIWMPVLGKNAFQRLVLGGAGANVLQGIAMRGTTELILDGTPAAKAFEAFDPKSITLDAILGLAFGSFAQLSPAQRAHGADVLERLKNWGAELSPSQVDAVATLRTAQHLNEDSAPGRPVEPKDVAAHVDRVRTAIDQLVKDGPVEVSDLPEPQSTPEPGRFTAAARRAAQMQKEGDALAKAYDMVLEQPLGPANEPVVRLTPEEIGDVLVERGTAFQKQGSAEIKVGGYGLVKFIWKHGEKSAKAEGAQVTREDVMRAPEILRDYTPISDVRKDDGRHLMEWQVEREDGKRVIYATSKFTAGDGEHHLVSVFVNDRDEPRFLEKGISEKRNRLAESPGGASKARPGDTGLETSSSSTGGQESGSQTNNGTKGPAGQPPVAEPPPPRGPGGEPAGPAAEAKAKPDPLADEAARIVQERPDLAVTVGTDADGNPVTLKASEYLKQAEDAAKRLEDDQELVRAAAACLMGSA